MATAPNNNSGGLPPLPVGDTGPVMDQPPAAPAPPPGPGGSLPPLNTGGSGGTEQLLDFEQDSKASTGGSNNRLIIMGFVLVNVLIVGILGVVIISNQGSYTSDNYTDTRTTDGDTTMTVSPTTTEEETEASDSNLPLPFQVDPFISEEPVNGVFASFEVPEGFTLGPIEDTSGEYQVTYGNDDTADPFVSISYLYQREQTQYYGTGSCGSGTMVDSDSLLTLSDLEIEYVVCTDSSIEVIADLGDNQALIITYTDTTSSSIPVGLFEQIATTVTFIPQT